jgi:hypothetical protein
MACVGVNGESNLGFDLSKSAKQYTYFTAPAGHTFIWRLFSDRKEAAEFLSKLTPARRRHGMGAGDPPLQRHRAEVVSLTWLVVRGTATPCPR